MEKYKLERKINHLNSQKSKIANGFNDSILDRLFFITKELILFQKLIFGK
ncbi:hypothetical protein [uncultured Algibacter sp.]|nr:hypothetical protein [uncultured Algibacter sp.]